MKRFEFSKIVLCFVMASYFIGLAFGIKTVSHIVTTAPAYAAQALCGLLSYIGAPVAVTIGFYSYKAKAENVEKIKKGNAEAIPEIKEERFDEYEEADW